MINYKIIGSSSRGNAVRVEGVMFDCGMPFSDMKPELYKCHSLLITHTHSDHINPNTIKRIIKEFPWIKIYGNPAVAYKVHVDHVVITEPFTLKDGTVVTPFNAVHDVLTTGFMLKIGDTDVLYTTDTAKVIIPGDTRFDYFFIESNYDEVKLREAAKKYARGKYDPADSQYRHLSTQQAKGVYYSHRKSKDSMFIELHKSGRFY